MSLLKYEIVCDSCNEQFFVVTEPESKVPEFCPLCGSNNVEEIESE